MSERARVAATDAGATEKPSKFTPTNIVAIVIVLTAAAAALWYVLAPWEAIAIYVFVPAMFALVLLNERFPRIGALWGALFGAYWRVTFWLLAAVLPVFGARLLSDIVAGAPLSIALGVLAVWIGIYLMLVLQVASERRRKSFWRRARRVDRVAPFLYAFSVGFVATILFATLTYVLADRDVIEFSAGSTVAAPVDAFDFFVWHLLDSIPVLDVTQTLHWEMPLEYTDGGVGAVLIAFKLLAILPIIGAFLAFWRYNREGTGEEPAVAQVTPDP